MLLKINPQYESLVPRPTPEEYTALKESIKSEGQHYLIEYNQEGEILDGHSRYQVCKELGIEPKIADQPKIFPSKLDEKIFVITTALKRRHLNSFQRTELELVLEPLLAEKGKQNLSAAGKKGMDNRWHNNLVSPETSLEVEEIEEKAPLEANPPITPIDSLQTVADKAKVGRATVAKVKAILEKAPEKIVEECRDGKRTINSGYSYVKDTERQEKRKEAVEKISQLPPLTETATATTMLSRRLDDNKRLNLLSANDWVINTKSWFILNPPQRSDIEELHPAKFPEALAKLFIEFFTQPSQIVLDPFAGTASTLVACDQTGRQGIGVELESKYAEIGKHRTKQPIIEGDSTSLLSLPLLCELIGQVDFAFTSPPYWNMLTKSRGNVTTAAKTRASEGLDVSYCGSANNLENIEDYDAYLDRLLAVFKDVHTLLRPKHYIVIVLQNVLVESGEMKPVAWDLAKKLSGLFLLKQERIWCQDNKPLGCWGYPTRYVSSVHHHYCLIFEKVEGGN